MKKAALTVLASLLFLSVCSTAFAIIAIPAGIRSAGMGGCGIAVSKGLAAVPYNPAGLMQGGMFEARLGAGVTDKQIDKVQELQSMIGNPEDIITEKYKDALDINALGGGLAGISFAKFGLSAIPAISAFAYKEKDSTVVDSMAFVAAPIALTLGQTFQTPFLPFSTLDVGGNLKSISSVMGGFNSAAGTSGYSFTSMGSGTGLDLGLLGQLDIPALTKLSFGAVVRDAFQSLTYNTTSTDYTIALGPPPVLTKGAEQDDKTIVRVPTTWGAGVGATLPGFGTLLTSDIVDVCGKDELTGKNGVAAMHFGVEQPVLMGLLNFRFGWATGENPYSTLGLGLNLVVASLDIAYVTDSKDSKGNAIGIEVSGGF